VEQIHKRSAYRITVALRAQLERAGAESGARQGESGPAVVTNLSGGSLAATPQGFPRQGNPSGPLRGDRAIWPASARTSWKRGSPEGRPRPHLRHFPRLWRAPGALLSAGGYLERTIKERASATGRRGWRTSTGPLGPPYERPPNSQTGRMEPVAA